MQALSQLSYVPGDAPWYSLRAPGAGSGAALPTVGASGVTPAQVAAGCARRPTTAPRASHRGPMDEQQSASFRELPTMMQASAPTGWEAWVASAHASG